MLDKSNVDRASEAEGGDRRSRRREATKAEILDAAWAIAREQGLTAISLRELAARVGMRAPSLYQYFDSKHAIYDAMFGQAARQAIEEVGIARVDTSDARGALRDRMHAMVRFMTTDPARASLLFQRTIPGFEPSAESYAPAVEFLDSARTGMASIGITDADALDMWTALVSGLANQQLANDPGGDRWIRLIDRAVDMYLAEVAPQLLKPKKGKK
jgi:AcrR family transcriptional regulator